MTIHPIGKAELVPHEIDYVLIANTFHGVPDKTALAQTVARVLKPNFRTASEDMMLHQRVIGREVV